MRTSVSANGRSLENHRVALGSTQGEGEVVSITLVHHLQAYMDQALSPGIQHTTVGIQA